VKPWIWGIAVFSPVLTEPAMNTEPPVLEAAQKLLSNQITAKTLSIPFQWLIEIIFNGCVQHGLLYKLVSLQSPNGVANRWAPA
jgi:hypothetical protein